MASRLITSIKNYIMSNKEDKVVEEGVKDVVETQVTEEAPVEEKKEPTPEEKLQVAEDKFLRLFSEFENFKKNSKRKNRFNHWCFC